MRGQANVITRLEQLCQSPKQTQGGGMGESRLIYPDSCHLSALPRRREGLETPCQETGCGFLEHTSLVMTLPLSLSH